MGRPKALLDFDGRTALSLALEACRVGGADEIVVVLGAAASEIEPRVLEEARAGPAEGRIRAVRNERFREGQTTSVKAGAAALAEGSGILVYPVDHPLLLPEDVEALARAFGRDAESSRRIFVATHRKRRGHPVLFGGGLRRAILDLGDEEPLHRIVRAIPGRVVEVPVRNEFALDDADTPEDHARLLAAYRARRAAP